MEVVCEFCTELRPVIYCGADAAYLCLPCDAKVHSANAVSSRHLRALLCDSCRNRPAYARYLDHRMMICHGCDQTMHRATSHHQKCVVSCYIGCPSAKEFASLWGFELDEVVKSPSNLEIGYSSITSKPSSSSGSSSKIEMLCESREQQNDRFILQQILDLKRLQLSEVNSSSPIIRDREQMATFPSVLDPSDNIDDSILRSDSTCAFSQQEQLPLSSTATNPLLVDSFWHCKSPIHGGQLWPQNMLDIDVCEDVVSHDDLNIPDIDTTFRNLEDLFDLGGNQEPLGTLLDDQDVSCSSVCKDLSADKSNENPRTREASPSTSSINVKQEQGCLDNVHHTPTSMDAPMKTRPSHSTLSFSVSMLSAESSGSEYIDNDTSPDATLNDKDMEHPPRNRKKVRYAPGKNTSSVCKRVRARLVKKQGYESDRTIGAAGSY